MQCINGKTAYSYATAAHKARRASARYDSPMASYKCRDCGAWHVGNAMPQQPKQLKTIANNHEWRAV